MASQITTRYSHYSRDRGCKLHVVERDGDCLGWVHEVFPDVFYVQPKDGSDNTRYHRMADAVASFERR